MGKDLAIDATNVSGQFFLKGAELVGQSILKQQEPRLKPLT